MNDRSLHIALPAGYELHWYRIEQVLGQGAFGITYLAHDVNLDRRVAVKEYLPGQFAIRNKDFSVGPITAGQSEDFEWGLKRFISEARTLTKFEHPHLVRVFNVFEMNNTAYMVMNYELGKSLQQILKNRDTLREDEIIKILFPLLSGLELMHEKGFVHRDIKPGNIFIRGDGSPVLLDFGSARQTRASKGRDGGEETTTTLTTLVSPGYAPIEQYGTSSDRQGPWTDIYGLGATLYRALTGLTPIAAVERGDAILHDSKDPYLPLTETYKDRYSKNFLAAIDHAMAFKVLDRPQNIAGWRVEFGISETMPATGTETPIKIHEGDTVKMEQPEQKTEKISMENTVTTEPLQNEAEAVIPVTGKKTFIQSGKRNLLIAGVVIVFILIGTMLLFNGDETDRGMEIKPTPAAVSPLAETDMPEEAVLPEEQHKQELKQKQIRELLRLAREDIAALRLTSPKDNNAFDKYLAVLKLDDNNEEARTGIQAISDKYVAMAYKAMEANKLNNAESYLGKAAAITPNSQNITTAREDLQAKRTKQAAAVSKEEPVETEQTAGTEEEPNENFWTKVKKWHEENQEQSKKIKKPDTIDERVRKTIGGQ